MMRLAALLTVAFVMGQTAVGFEKITITTSSTAISSSTYDPSSRVHATICRGSLETANIRIRYDGVAPTSTVGELIQAGSTIEITGYANIVNFRAIRDTAASSNAVLTLTCAQ